MGTPVSFSFTLVWEINRSFCGEQDILAAVLSVDTDTFLLRVPMDSLGLLVPQGRQGKRSVCTLCIFSLRKHITSVIIVESPSIQHVGQRVYLVIVAINHSGDTDLLVLICSQQGKEGLKGIQGPPGLPGLIVRKKFSFVLFCRCKCNCRSS